SRSTSPGTTWTSAGPSRCSGPTTRRPCSPRATGRSGMLKKLAEYLGREVEVWTTENTEPWMGILKEANADYIQIMIDELSTYLVTNKVVAFSLSEGEQGANEEEGSEEE